MAKRKTQQVVGGGKEAPLAVVGNSDVQQHPQHKQIFTPEDAEYQRYSELLQGFFKTFTRWREILAAEEYKKSDDWRGFSVFRSDNGFSILPGHTREVNDPTDKVLQVRNRTYLHDPVFGLGERFYIRPGTAWKHLLVDPEDGRPLKEVTINVSSQFELRELDIETKRPDIRGEQEYPYRHRGVNYSFRWDTLKVSHELYPAMTDEMATNLINTIDRLIPSGTPTASQQPERRLTPELITAPRPLPAPRRRTPRG